MPAGNVQATSSAVSPSAFHEPAGTGSSASNGATARVRSASSAWWNASQSLWTAARA